jgi:hypothetical protein
MLVHYSERFAIVFFAWSKQVGQIVADSQVNGASACTVKCEAIQLPTSSFLSKVPTLDIGMEDPPKDHWVHHVPQICESWVVL